MAYDLGFRVLRGLSFLVGFIPKPQTLNRDSSFPSHRECSAPLSEFHVPNLEGQGT